MYLTSLGATHVDRAFTPLQNAITTHTANPVLVVFDAISSPETQQTGYSVLTPSGGMLTTLDLEVPENSGDKKALRVHVPQSRAFGHGEPPGAPRGRANRVEELPGGLQGILNGIGRL
ncbi:hypothetical protein C8R43DRAFT_1141398 [Mycena crocata]|nr:hypothetical protein C8R43DRAFT_1141398 [Mycena crocata]